MHRESALDFWLTLATVVALFVPIWGVLLQPTGLVTVRVYLMALGLPALAVVGGVLWYAARRNRVLLNRFLVGYAAGLAGTAAITLLLLVGERLLAAPSLVVALGNAALGRYPAAPPTVSVVVAGVAYHFLLNGAAWGAAYALLFGKAPWWLGILYGFFVWAVLVLSPPLYQWGFTGGGAGAVLLVVLLIQHLIYGGVVGAITYQWVFPEVGMEGLKAIRPLYG